MPKHQKRNMWDDGSVLNMLKSHFSHATSYSLFNIYWPKPLLDRTPCHQFYDIWEAKIDKNHQKHEKMTKVVKSDTSYTTTTCNVQWSKANWHVMYNKCKLRTRKNEKKSIKINKIDKNHRFHQLGPID